MWVWVCVCVCERERERERERRERERERERERMCEGERRGNYAVKVRLAMMGYSLKEDHIYNSDRGDDGYLCG